jgi:cation diffusion facilitator CzcD-associated flavoprotein CzcO
MVHGMQLQAARFGAVFHQDIVVSVDTKTRPFTVRTNETDIKTHSVVVATGADSRWLGVQGEWEMRGGGVSSCATCDGYLFADQDVVVIGGGDTAMEDALVLARTSKSVTVIHRRDKFRASKVLAGRVLSHPKISVRWDSEVVAFEGKRQRVLPSGIAVEIDADGKILEEDMSKLRVKEVQKRLDAAGISYAGIKDKEQLVATYKKAVADALKEQQEPNDEGSAGQVKKRTILTLRGPERTRGVVMLPRGRSAPSQHSARFILMTHPCFCMLSRWRSAPS